MMKHLIPVLFAAGAVLLAAADESRAQTQEICPDRPVPPDWVVVDILARTGRCRPGHLDKMLKIQNTRMMQAGAALRVCLGSPLPRGWVVTGKERCAACCGAAGQPVERNIIKKIKN
ncbi:hypothetical protein [Candidatus Electronema sp. JM]|uniref:hypothetical protein n=1 Tax=Candidatus Electronema sp. JM TaxID=3401571 RepID=UPI003AA810FD